MRNSLSKQKLFNAALDCALDTKTWSAHFRFFCMQHINLPVVEKIARMEKNICKGSDSIGKQFISYLFCVWMFCKEMPTFKKIYFIYFFFFYKKYLFYLQYL